MAGSSPAMTMRPRAPYSIATFDGPEEAPASSHCKFRQCRQSKRAADRSAALAQFVSGRSLLQVAHRRQVEGQLGDTGRAAPIGADAGRIDRGNIRAQV